MLGQVYIISGKSADLRSKTNEGRHIGLIRHTSDSQCHSFAFECPETLRSVIQRDAITTRFGAHRNIDPNPDAIGFDVAESDLIPFTCEDSVAVTVARRVRSPNSTRSDE